MSDSPSYASLDGRPVRVSDSEAWWIVDGKWEEMNAGIAFASAALLSEAEFKKTFPGLPNLPAAAFKAPT